MNTLRIRTLLSLFLLLVVPGTSFARLLPQWSIEEEVTHAELIVQGHLTGPVQVVVEKVFLGPARPSDTLMIDYVSELPSEAFHDTTDLGNWQVRDSYIKAETGEIVQGKRQPRPSVHGQSMVLFLVRDQKTQRWYPYGGGSGVKYLLGDVVYGYQQPQNPGPYVLFFDREVKTAADLYRAIQEGVKKRGR